MEHLNIFQKFSLFYTPFQKKLMASGLIIFLIFYFTNFEVNEVDPTNPPTYLKNHLANVFYRFCYIDPINYFSFSNNHQCNVIDPNCTLTCVTI